MVNLLPSNTLYSTCTENKLQKIAKINKKIYKMEIFKMLFMPYHFLSTSSHFPGKKVWKKGHIGKQHT